MILLKDLPITDERRNTPLKEIDAHIRNWKSKNWRNINTWKIGPFCYNDLSTNWLMYNDFGIPDAEHVAKLVEILKAK